MSASPVTPMTIDESLKPGSEPTPEWMDEFKNLKHAYTMLTAAGDMPPTLVAFRNGKRIFRAISPIVDNAYAYKAANMLKAALDPDELLFAADSHVTAMQIEPGKSEEEVKAWLRDNYKPGEMQRKCDEEGACARGEMIDALMIIRINAKGTASGWSVPYHHHDHTTPLIWHPAGPQTLFMESDKPGLGYVVESLRKVMARDMAEDDGRLLIDRMMRAQGVSKEARFYLMSSGLAKSLTETAFCVINYLPKPHDPLFTDSEGEAEDNGSAA